MNLNVFQFALPLKTNDNTADYDRQLVVWEELALDEGGFTTLGDYESAWREDSSDVVYREKMRHYQFAGDDDAASRLMKAAMELFPDQVSFYVARIGTANIVVNPQPPAKVQSLTPPYKPAYAGKFKITQ